MNKCVTLTTVSVDGAISVLCAIGTSQLQLCIAILKLVCYLDAETEVFHGHVIFTFTASICVNPLEDCLQLEEFP